MSTLRVPRGRPTARSSVYVVAVGALAALGFIRESPWPILLAALLAVPASILAVPAYYLAYGLLALVPGANPSSSSGSGSVAPDGTVVSVSSGSAADWFTVTTHLLGIVALTAAAVVDVMIVRAFAARRQGATTVARPADVPGPMHG